MAGNNTIKGLTVEIGGDTTKLGKALESVNRRSRDLSSELGEINRLLKLDPGNADLLAQKQKVLAEAVENTRRKLDTLREAEKQVQAQFERGEVSEEQVRALQREIVQTEQKMESYERASRETAQQIDKLGDESEEAKKDVDKLGDEAKDTGKELEKAGDKASTFGDRAKRAGEIAAKGIAAVTAVVAAAGAALVKATADAAAYADEILTTSTVTGISTEKLQAYSYAAELVDVSVETLTKSHAKNIKSMKAAQDGTKLAVDAYERLGVSVMNADGSLRDGEMVYWEVIDALGKMENETERDALAMQILGKSAQELNPLIEAGSEKMAELTQEAKEVGAVMSDESLQALGAFDDALQRLKGSAGAAKNSLGTVLLPELTALAQDGTSLLSDFTKNLNASGGGLDGFISTVDKMSGQIGEKVGELVGGAITKMSDLLPSLIKVGMSMITTLATSIIHALPQLVAVGFQTVEALISGLSSALPAALAAVKAVVPDLARALSSGADLILQAGIDLLMALCEAIPPTVVALTAEIPSLVMSVVNGLLNAIPQLLTGATQFLMAVCQAIPIICQQLAPQIAPIISTICDGLISNIPLLLDAALLLLDAICQAIPQICDALLPEVPKIVQTLTDKLVEMVPLLLDGAITLLFALVDAIPILLDSLLPQIPMIIDSVVATLVKLTPVLLQAAIKLFFAIIQAVGQIVLELGKQLPNIWKTIQSVLSVIPRVLWGILSNALAKVGEWIVQLASKAFEAGSKFISGIVQWFSQLPGKIWSWLSNAANKVASWGTSLVAKGKAAAKKLFDVVVNTIKSLPNKIKECGKNLVEGLWKGINGAYDWIKGKIKGWVGNVTDFLKNLFGINSPSKKTAWMGEMLAEGLAKGVEDNASAPMDAMGHLSDEMLDEAAALDGLALSRQINHTFSPASGARSVESGMLDKLDRILAAIERGQILTIDGSVLVGATADAMNGALGQRRALAARGAV